VITDMPRPRPPYLSHERTRHGKSVWYVRRDGKRIRIKAEFGTSEFSAEYQAAIATSTAIAEKPAKCTRGTLAWLIERYCETAAWTDLSPATRRQRANIFKHVIATAGTAPTVEITRASIGAGRDRRAATPAQARHFIDTMRGLFRWALEAEHVEIDPTDGIKYPKQRKSDGFIPWTEDDVDAYEQRWPIGTRQRVWLDVLLYTGLRRGDAVQLGRQHVRDGVASLKTEKTDTPVMLPILPALAASLKAGPCGDLTFIAGENGRPLTKESFGNLFRKACRAAGVPGSAHGLRKVAATRAANNGATVAELEATFGWTGGRMASLYTRAADRKRLAANAMHKLGSKRTAGEQSIVAPKGANVAPWLKEQ
jgi:integrase